MMKIKLLTSIAGDRFSYKPRDVVTVNDISGERMILKHVAVEAPKDAKVDGNIPDMPAKPRPKKERAIRPAPETPEAGAGDGACGGKTKAGNPCKRAAIGDAGYCQAHLDQAE